MNSSHIIRTMQCARCLSDSQPRIGGVRLTTLIQIAALSTLLVSGYSRSTAIVSVHERIQNGYAGQFIWENEISNTEVLCTDRDGCSLAICHYSPAEYEMCINPSAAYTRVFIPFGARIQEARNIFVQKNGVAGDWSTFTPLLTYPETCFGLIVWQGRGNGNRSGKVLPGSYCGKIPPPNLTCDLLGDVIYEYGSVAGHTVHGMAQTQNLSLTCTDTANITLTVPGEGGIIMGGGVTSQLFVNDTALSSGVRLTVSAGAQHIPIKSVLHSPAEPKPGHYEGSSVVVLGFQ